MLKRITSIILIILLVSAFPAAAKKNTAAGTFTEQYDAARAKGPDALLKFKTDIANGGSDAEVEMLRNLNEGKTADGKPLPKGNDANQPAQQPGFMGDAKDPGPQDWSDTVIETDGKGNVTGFKPKDWYDRDTDGDGEVSQEEQRVHDSKEQFKNMDKDGDGNVHLDEIRAAEAEMDKDGDGKVSDEERKEWNDKTGKERKKKEKNAPGAPGHVPPVADWDKDGDGVPDKGWQTSCWQCCAGEEFLNECHSGRPGNCDNGGSCEISEICLAADEEHDGKKYQCHTCEYINDQVDWCLSKGYSSDPTCGGCPSGPCIPIDVDISDGSIVPTNQTRERGSTRQCYACMKVESIQISYHVFVIRRGFDFVVFDRDKMKTLNALADFDVSSVMGLSQADSPAMDKVKSLMGSMGLDPMAILGGGMNISSLSNMLKQGMEDKKNKYGENCFDEFQRPNFANQAPTSSSAEDIKESKKNKKKGIEGGPRTEGPPEFGIDPEQAMSLDGPVIACGKSGKEKALMIMDSSGNPIQKILQSTFENDPNAIINALQKAQSMNQNIQAMVQGGPSGMINNLRQKAIGMVKKKIQDVVFGKKGDPGTTVVPNDQFFMKVKTKKKKLLGILGGSAPTLMGGIGGGGSAFGVGVNTNPKEKLELDDQWGIQRVGYLPKSDAGSAWNIADGEDKNVIVAVIDSGIDLDHPDSPQYVWTNPNEIADNHTDDDGNGLIDDIHGWNFVDQSNDLTDEVGHGTHVAGIIAAKRDNSIGIAGINPGAIIMPVKVANEEGRSDLLRVYQGINYAVNHGAQVINVSMGGLGDSAFLQPALDRARQLGAFVVVASGNTGEYSGNVAPASANYAFTVSAIDYDGEWSTISSVGPNIALLAPGEEILSLRSKDSFSERAIKDPILRLYFRQSGTSFSTPMVTGTASLLLTKNPKLTPEQIEDILLNTANDLGDAGWDDHYGAGLLNAAEALKAANRTDFVTVKLDRITINKDEKKRYESVDVYATVRGDIESFTVGVGKGKRASKFEQVAGPFTQNANNDWVARISKDNLRGSDEWVVNIDVKDKNGHVKSAQALLEIK